MSYASNYTDVHQSPSEDDLQLMFGIFWVGGLAITCFLTSSWLYWRVDCDGFTIFTCAVFTLATAKPPSEDSPGSSSTGGNPTRPALAARHRPSDIELDSKVMSRAQVGIE